MISTLISRISLLSCLFTTPVLANDIFLQMYGDSFEASLTQTGADNFIDITVFDNNNRTVINQNGNNHSAIINLSGPNHNDVELYQYNPLGNTFSLTQICTNPSGCVVIVMQQ